jgi:hypothetical protein
MGANALTAGTAVLPWFGHLSKQESLNLGINSIYLYMEVNNENGKIV